MWHVLYIHIYMCVMGNFIWRRQGSTMGQMGYMMATDDVGCTAKSITTCNNLSWSLVSLSWGEKNPSEILHRAQVAPFINSLCPCEYLAVSCDLQGFSSAWQGYLTHSCHPLIFPGLYQSDMPLSSALVSLVFYMSTVKVISSP
jgi:hypothetical protein